MLADTVVLLKSTMEAMKAEILAIKDKAAGHSDLWCDFNGYLNNSRSHRTVTNLIPITVSQGIPNVGAQPFIPVAPVQLQPATKPVPACTCDGTYPSIPRRRKPQACSRFL